MSFETPPLFEHYGDSDEDDPAVQQSYFIITYTITAECVKRKRKLLNQQKRLSYN